LPDAAAYYLRAAAAAPGDYSPRTPPLMMANARRVWDAQGGTADGFEAWRGRCGGRQERVALDRNRVRAMPEFSLRTRPADRCGWRNWRARRCSSTRGHLVRPCQAELPYVQRLQKSQRPPDVVVLTFNIDENPGIVLQYMKQQGFTFFRRCWRARRGGHDEGGFGSAETGWWTGRACLRLERQAGADESFVRDVASADCARVGAMTDPKRGTGASRNGASSARLRSR